ncbi:MAG: isoleucine--tRNA ligase [Gammaproteobacteria bacterium]|nr:isoleucine--tRNA ligase [Gammaproteobacteria bacterium]
MSPTDYKNTLNLPHTDFPMRGNLPAREPKQVAQWQSLGLYERLRLFHKDHPRYVLHDGPPYANGAIHLGHAVNKTLKDIIIKAKGFAGFDAPYVPGWDCHGLPIELAVEKTIGRCGRDVDAKTFRAACRDYARAQVDGQRQDFERLGVIGDFAHPYLTMDYAFEANIVRELGRIMAQGHVYRSEKPVHWCVDCRSALAEAEVDYEDHKSRAIDVAFAVADAGDLAARVHEPGFDKPAALVIWTTTPWTLPANQAVAVHPDILYRVIEGALRYFVVADALAPALVERYGIGMRLTDITVSGAALVGMRLVHPFLERTVPVIPGLHVTTEAGTGLVHIAPAHGEEDYQAVRQYARATGIELPIEGPVGGDGRFVEGTPFVGGLTIEEGGERLIALLDERGALLHVESIVHSYPHCWRHKSPIVFRATAQWFISMDQAGLRERALGVLADVGFQPAWGRERISQMVANRPDWCISRQRAWGVPLPFFLHRTTGALHPRTAGLLEEVACAIEREGIDGWFGRPPKAWLGSEAADYEAVTDVLDVWFDSGSTHACVLAVRAELTDPADLYLEGSDQHRGWFQSSLLTSVADKGRAPYRMVLTHGFTVDAQGQKMAKSKGNGIEPREITDSLGADVLRLWVAATDYRSEMALSQEILKRVTDSYRRLRNTARYLLANLDGFDPLADWLRADELLALDRWALARLGALDAEIREAYERFHFHLVYQKLHQFCVVDLGSFYLDVLKDRLYTSPRHSLERRSAQTALAHILEALVRYLAPILSFTAEEIWQYMPGARSESVFLSTWHEVAQGRDGQGEAAWREILALRAAVGPEIERLRTEGAIGSSLDGEIDLYVGPELMAFLAPLHEEAHYLFIVSAVRLHPLHARPPEAVATGRDDVWVKVVPSADGKCARCWHHKPDVGRYADHPALCGRCVATIGGRPKLRRYA